MTAQGARAAVVLAAGDGKRLKSARPKVVHRAAGRPLLGHVLAALSPLGLDHTVVVSSRRLEEVKSSLAECGFSDGLAFAVQDPPRGTGDAARIGMGALAGFDGAVLVAPGDTPLLTTETLERAFVMHSDSEAAATVVTATLEDPTGYGRIIRGEGDTVERIVEHRDASPDDLLVHEIGASVYVFDARLLSEMLGKIDASNAQGEYYLTDVIGLLRAAGEVAVALETDAGEVGGVNDRAQLADAARALRARACERWLAAGVSIVDPATTFIDATVEIEPDATIHPFTFLEGTTVVGARAEVGPQSRIVDSTIGEDATVTFAVVRESVVGAEASVGPYASLRPGTRLERRAHLGSFVEAKNTIMGEDSKANHLAYLGDAELGARVNIGAGTVTCNWDGVNKNKTVIEDDAYISSDTMLIAPVRVGKRAATGAGSVVREDVPDDALAVGVPARIIEGKGNRMKPKAGTKPDDPRQ